MLASRDLDLPDENATEALGAALARAVGPGQVVYLEGDLGAGKTTLVRACLRGLGYAQKVKSPTYTLVEPYDLSRLIFYHFDFYRLREPREWLDAGFRDYFNSASACFVEWPEKADSSLPPPDLKIRLEHRASSRIAHLEALTPQGLALLKSASNTGA